MKFWQFTHVTIKTKKVKSTPRHIGTPLVTIVVAWQLGALARITIG
jgi:hypothetical protein